MIDKETAAYHFKRAGCRIPGFGNGCNTCPIRKKLERCCSYDNHDGTINVGKFLYFTDKKYHESIKTEIKEDPDFRPYVCGCKIV